MMRSWKITRCLIGLSLGLASANIIALENVFYAMRNDYNSIMKHEHAIHILAPQGYIVQSNGTVTGYLNEKLVDHAHQHHIKLMPLVTNSSFDQGRLHKFLINPNAQKKTIDFLVSACKNQNLHGVQIDFENIAAADQKSFTRFYQNLAQQLHRNGFAISVAIVPRLTDQVGDSAYLQLKHKNWRGAYDYKALGTASDFVTIMSYDQHEGATTPGPIAAMPWVRATVEYAVKYISPKKISLGIPTYSGHWLTSKTSKRISAFGYQIDYETLLHLLDKHRVKLQWDHHNQVPFAFFTHKELNEFIFAENATSFKTKLDLVKRYKLRGVSVWRLGVEDPLIWRYIN